MLGKLTRDTDRIFGGSGGFTFLPRTRVIPPLLSLIGGVGDVCRSVEIKVDDEDEDDDDNEDEDVAATVVVMNGFSTSFGGDTLNGGGEGVTGGDDDGDTCG